MSWSREPRRSQAYLVAIYLVAIPAAISVLAADDGRYSSTWVALTTFAIFVATVNIRLPKASSVISTGDVFVILAFLNFNAGPALITYWLSMLAAHASNTFRKHGLKGNVIPHRLLFNLGCCALSVFAMTWGFQVARNTHFEGPLQFLLTLAAIASSWFIVNTVTLSFALTFSQSKRFIDVWIDGAKLYCLNFVGSAAAAGLINSLYEHLGFLAFSLSLPIAFVLYQMYSFYVARLEQAQDHIRELNKLYLQTIEAMASAVDAKDRYTHGHIRRVQVYADELARCMGINEEKDLMALKAGALLHDIGKLAIPEYILNKPTALTEGEYQKMKIHPAVGAQLLQGIDFPYPVIPLVRSHHERWDGNGYPDGLAGESIPFSARLLSLIDCYDALTTNRPYRSPMPKDQLIEFFRRESGKAYDPAIVTAFIDNIDRIEAAAANIQLPSLSLWESGELGASNLRPLERVQPTVSYGKALDSDIRIQREIFAAFEFARTDMQCLSVEDLLTFMGGKLANIISFDAAVFFIAKLGEGVVKAEHVLGNESAILAGLTIPLEQKLSGWVAANNQSLCNLPPFPDFLKLPEPRPTFAVSAIVPLHRNGEVLGTIALYRKSDQRFTDNDFRRLEILASQTALGMSRIQSQSQTEPVLFDPLTKIPNGFQLLMMFDQVATDAARFDYPIALLCIGLDSLASVRKRWGYGSADEAAQLAIRQISLTLSETDLLFRYSDDQLILLAPRRNRDGAEELKSRLQDIIDHITFDVRPGTHISLLTSIGIVMFPEDESTLDKLLETAAWRMEDDRAFRAAAGYQQTLSLS